MELSFVPSIEFNRQSENTNASHMTHTCLPKIRFPHKRKKKEVMKMKKNNISIEIRMNIYSGSGIT